MASALAVEEAAPPPPTEQEQALTSFDLLDIVRLPPILLRSRMLVRCLDQSDKRWLQAFCLLTETCLLMLQPGQTWTRIALLHAQVRQDTGQFSGYFELSTARKTYNFRAKHEEQAGEWVRVIALMSGVESDNSGLLTGEHLLQDYSEGRVQHGLLTAAASIMHAGDGGPGGGGMSRLAPRPIGSHTSAGALSLPPWAALRVAARQHAALTGGGGKGAEGGAMGGQEAMLWWTGKGAGGEGEEERGGRERVLHAHHLLLGPAGVGAAGPLPSPRPPLRLMPAILQDAVLATAAGAPLVAAHAVLLEGAGLAGCDLPRLERAVRLGSMPLSPPPTPHPMRRRKEGGSQLVQDMLQAGQGQGGGGVVEGALAAGSSLRVQAEYGGGGSVVSMERGDAGGRGPSARLGLGREGSKGNLAASSSASSASVRYGSSSSGSSGGAGAGAVPVVGAGGVRAVAKVAPQPQS